MAYCRRHVLSLVAHGGAEAPLAAAEEEAGEGQEVAAGGARAEPGGPPGVTGPDGGEGLAGDEWELTATDEHGDGSELVEVMGPASAA